VKVLQDKGHDVSLLRAKNIAEFSGPQAPRLDFVFTVCNQSANEDCPAWDGQPVTGHWGIPDPVKAQGTEAEKALAFQRAYGTLERWIETFVALPIETLERIALQSAVDDIAASSPEIVA
jgi:arsenate reductase